MANTPISSYLYASVVLMVLAGLVIGIVSSAYVSKPSMMGTDDLAFFNKFNKSFDMAADMQNQTEQMQAAIENKDVNPIEGFLNALVGNAWSYMQFLGTSFSFITDGFKALAELFHVPKSVVTGLSMLVIIMIAMTLYTAVFRTQL